MKIVRVNSETLGSKIAFSIIREATEKGAVTLGLATGSTPLKLYKEMRESSVDFSGMTALNLDEYVGLPVGSDQSYAEFMKANLFATKPFKETFIPDGRAADLEAECVAYDKLIDEHPIDVQILGIGTNGHIGFNEPGSSFVAGTSVVNLTESTIEANKRFFASASDVPTQAVSMGIASIVKAKKIILIAFGEGKADAVRKMLYGEVTEDMPASILQRHPDVTVILDDESDILI
ncbi:MAG: glucosamine-6-phosphate deaminase [Lactobacillales bacterium]|jgi:glucosamine-6-phosphate deaminase|nr:glucosamine-6-phosphate deaminase [Lactobacillales bacterium]